MALLLNSVELPATEALDGIEWSKGEVYASTPTNKNKNKNSGNNKLPKRLPLIKHASQSSIQSTSSIMSSASSVASTASLMRKKKRSKKIPFLNIVNIDGGNKFIYIFARDVTEWSIADVYHFISKVGGGCFQGFASILRRQQITGPYLLRMTRSQLQNDFSVLDPVIRRQFLREIQSLKKQTGHGPKAEDNKPKTYHSVRHRTKSEIFRQKEIRALMVFFCTFFLCVCTVCCVRLFLAIAIVRIVIYVMLSFNMCWTSPRINKLKKKQLQKEVTKGKTIRGSRVE